MIKLRSLAWNHLGILYRFCRLKNILEGICGHGVLLFIESIIKSPGRPLSFSFKEMIEKFCQPWVTGFTGAPTRISLFPSNKPRTELTTHSASWWALHHGPCPCLCPWQSTSDYIYIYIWFCEEPGFNLFNSLVPFPYSQFLSAFRHLPLLSGCNNSSGDPLNLFL